MYGKIDMENKAGMSKGFAIIEVSIAMVMLSLLLASVTAIIIHQNKNVKNIETKFDILDVKQQVDMVIANRANCENAFRADATNQAVFNPPADINAAYSAPIARMFLGNNPIFETNQVFSGVRIVSMQMRRTPGIANATMEYVSPIPPHDVTSVNSYSTELDVVTENMGGSFAGEQRTFSKAMTLYVNSATNRIISCAGTQKVILQRAIAKRVGPSAGGANCNVSAPPASYQGTPGCTGGSGNVCGDGVNAKIAHPYFSSGEKTAAYWQVVATSILSPDSNVGRCPVELLNNTSLEEPRKIFSIIYVPAIGDRPAYDGIGCNSANGWFISGCTRGDDGTGSSGDIDIVRYGDSEFCITADFARPHLSNIAYAIKSVGLNIICTKFE